MPPSAKAKASGVSASSFLDLKSELAKKETEFAKRKAAGKTYEAGSSRGALESDSGRKGKGTVWARSNNGIEARRARDIEALRADRATAVSTREALEKKAKIYEKLRRGKTGGLTDAQFDALLVDFDTKEVDDDGYSEHSDDVDESLTVPKPVDDEDDPIMDYVDEFGRSRTARKSEIPRELMPSAEGEGGDDEEDVDPFLVYNPVNHFPVYEPSAERVAEIEEAAKETDTTTHYDAAKEVRARGAAFYAFSTDEEQRRREMDNLRAAREETETARKDAGAVDAKVGEIEGMVAPTAEEGASGTTRSRAAEKRRREIEERRRLVDAKRRKVKEDREKETSPADSGEKEASSSTVIPSESQSQRVKDTADPFAALEANSRGAKDKKPAKDNTAEASDFLAQLEMELTSEKPAR